jgi:hypothetical protein
LATGLEVDVGVVKSALARGAQGPHQRSNHPANHAVQHRPAPHPNAPSSQRETGPETGGPAPPRPVAPPPIEELELIALLADHPALIATAEADKAFWLLTDDRLRAMYSAARAGQSLLELAPVQLSPPTAKHVLSGKYASKDAPSSLAAMTRNLEARKVQMARRELTRTLADAKRRGDHELARQLTQQNVAERTGNRELAMQLADARDKRFTRDERKTGSMTEKTASLVNPETSNRKQVE